MRHALFVLLALVGMLPGSILPVVVTAARHGLGFTIAQSSLVGAMPIVCAALGALTIALLGMPERWKRLAAAALVAIGLLDLTSIAVTDFTVLLTMRGLHGFVGGILTGIGYAGIGQAVSPDRLFGVLLVMQFLVGGAGIVFLPGMVMASGVWLLFAVLASAAALVFAIVPIMPNTLLASGGSSPRQRIPKGMILWGLLALLLIEAGHTAASAFMLELGIGRGIGMPATQSIVGLSAMAGIIGATGSSVFGARWGRTGPILWTSAAGVLSGALLLAPSPFAFAAGAFIGSIAWAWSIPLVLGGCATFDSDNPVAIWLSFVAKLGLAAGPLLGTLVIGEKNLEPAVILSCILGLAGALAFMRLGGAGTPATVL